MIFNEIDFSRNCPNEIYLQKNENFDINAFRNDLRSKLSKIALKSCGIFIQANHIPYVIKAMRTTTMKRLELLPRFRAEPTGLNKKDFKGKGIFQIDSTKRKEKIQQKSRCKESVDLFSQQN